MFTIERFPFDTDNPTGYLIAFSIQYILVLNTILNVMCTLTFTVSFFGILNALVKDIKGDLQSIDASAKIKTKRLLIVKQFNELIDLHSNAKQLSAI